MHSGRRHDRTGSSREKNFLEVGRYVRQGGTAYCSAIAPRGIHAELEALCVRERRHALPILDSSGRDCHVWKYFFKVK